MTSSFVVLAVLLLPTVSGHSDLHFDKTGLPTMAANSSAASMPGLSSSQKSLEATLKEIRVENDWKNDLVLWVLPSQVRAATPRLVQVRSDMRAPVRGQLLPERAA